jgi:hypothetical protein
METNFNKPNPKRLLGYLMAFAMVFFTTSYTIAQNAVTVTVGGGSYDSECSFVLTDSNGDTLALGGAGTYSTTVTLGDCYDMNMFDSYGDGWNNYIPSIYTVTDDTDGTVYATGSLANLLSSGTDNFCPTASVACADNAVLYTAGSYPGENSFTITDCDGNTIAEMTSGTLGYDACIVLPAVYSVNLFDSYGDTWNGGTLTIDGVTYDQPTTAGGGASDIYQVGACPVLGCTDATAANYNSAADTDDGSCTYGVPGCVDVAACNYDASATADDGSCTYALAGYDCAGACLSGEEVTLTLTDSYGDTWNGGTLTVNGVVYDQPTTGSSTTGASDTYVSCLDLSGCIDVTYSAGSYSTENSWSISDASGTVLASGGDNSDVLGTCVGGCTDATAFNYDASLVLDYDDGSCVAVANGCTDATAANYDANANTDDGSCTYGVPGCVDVLACNYDTSATADDGSCTYAVANYDCNGDCLN